MLPLSKKMSENFSNIDPIDPHLYDDKSFMNFVHPGILGHSIKTYNNKLEEELKQILCERKSCIFDTIKYIEGITWSIWMTPLSKIFRDINFQIYNFIKNKLNADIIYFNLKQYKKNLQNTKEVIIHCEFVYYQHNTPNAYHVSCISIVNLETQSLNILIVKVLGKISQDKIHMYQNKACTENQTVKTHEKILTDFHIEDDEDCMTDRDEKVENILYDSLLNDYSISEDAWKNMEYIRNQNIVRNMFLKDKRESPKSMADCFKKYPYNEDFKIIYEKKYT